MPIFEYQGFREDGKKESGIIDAENPKAARMKLRRDRILPSEIVEDRQADPVQGRSVVSVIQRVTIHDLSASTRQLATLMGANLSLVESLNTVAEQTENVKLKKIFTSIRERINEGGSLAQALSEHSSVFDHVYVSMVRAGETSGTLETILNRVADFIEHRLAQRNRVRNAMIYPIFMTVVGTGVLFFLIAFVMPKVTTMFDDIEQAMPLPTAILLAVTDFSAQYWFWMIALVASLPVLYRWYTKKEQGRQKMDRVLIGLPVLGKVIRTSAISRFARMFQILLESGVPLIQSMEIVRDVVKIHPMQEAIDVAIRNVQEGESMSDPLKRTGVFPPMVIQMIAAGERSGEVELVLGKIADAYESELENLLTGMLALLEPVLILVMGVLVGFIVLAILLPIFELSQMVR